jgi:hypothetical protein
MVNFSGIFFFLLQIGAVAEYCICDQKVSHLNFVCYVGNMSCQTLESSG